MVTASFGAERLPWQSCDDSSQWMPSPIWSPGSPRFSEDPHNKKEGKASVRIDFITDAANWYCIGISPIIKPPLNLSIYGGVSFFVYNPDPWRKKVGLNFLGKNEKSIWLRLSSEKSYMSYGTGDESYIPAGPGWSKVSFIFDEVHGSDRQSAVPRASLNGLTKAMLVFVDEKQEHRSGYMLIDDFKFLPRSIISEKAVPADKYPTEFAKSDPRRILSGVYLEGSSKLLQAKKIQASIEMLNKALDLSPYNARAVAGIEHLYKSVMNDNQRKAIKEYYSSRYNTLRKTDLLKAQGYSKLHARLVNIKSDIQPLFSFCVGTQTFGPLYQFTTKDKLLETAEVIRDMGTDTIKFYTGPGYDSMYGLDKSDDIRTLTDLVSKKPSFVKVLDMPFKNILLWMYPISVGNWWMDGIGKKSERDAEYKEVFDFACYLLKKYNNTGKTFLLGNWEGDWHLQGLPAKEPTPARITGLTAWFNLRQKAIDDAKKVTKHRNIFLYHYMEVNAVPAAMSGAPRLVNKVLPYTNVDFVSYSSYASSGAQFCKDGSMPNSLLNALIFIESNLPPREIPGKRVWIGEYGFALVEGVTPQIQDEYTRIVCKAALQWGCPFTLYWELYNNEYNEGLKQQMGFWMIDDKNVKQPVYFTHLEYYKNARKYLD
ncbi:MAG: hypothetical protein ACYC0V_22285, partial [Armatimonadota bacterium]